MNPRFQSGFPSPFQPEEMNKQKGPTTFDLLTRLLIPALSLIVVIFALSKEESTLAWTLLAILTGSLAISAYPWLKTQIQRGIFERQDNRIVRKALPEFQRFSRRFNEFVSPQEGRNLHSLEVSKLSASNPTNLEKLRLPPIDIFNQF